MEKARQNVEKILKMEPLNQRGYKFVGIGSDKVVLETPGSTRKIIKVSHDVLRQKVAGLMLNEINHIGNYDVKDNSRQLESLEEIKENEKEVREIFGDEHFLNTGTFKMKIPITKEFLVAFVDDSQKFLLERIPENFYSEVEMVAETQLVAEELKDPEKFSVKSFNTNLITDMDFYESKSLDQALFANRSNIDENFIHDVENLTKDEKYKKVITEIVSKLIQYTKKTGNMMDIFGPNNITIFTKENGNIDYHIIEAVLPGPKKNGI